MATLHQGEIHKHEFYWIKTLKLKDNDVEIEECISCYDRKYKNISRNKVKHILGG